MFTDGTRFREGIFSSWRRRHEVAWWKHKVGCESNEQAKTQEVTGWSCHEVGGWIQIKSSEGERKAAKPRRLLRPALKRQWRSIHGSSRRSQPRYTSTAFQSISKDWCIWTITNLTKFYNTRHCNWGINENQVKNIDIISKGNLAKYKKRVFKSAIKNETFQQII